MPRNQTNTTSVLVDCPECLGDGTIDDLGDDKDCRDCGGQGQVYRTVTS